MLYPCSNGEGFIIEDIHIERNTLANIDDDDIININTAVDIETGISHSPNCPIKCSDKVSNDYMCNFCFEECNIVENSLCECKFYYHPECLLQWVKTSKKTNCIMCDRDIDINKILENNSQRFYNIDYTKVNKTLITYLLSDSLLRRLIKLKSQLGELVINPDVEIEYIKPSDLLDNCREFIDIPDSHFFFKWYNIDNRLNENITLSMIPGIGIIYNKIIYNNGIERIITNVLNIDDIRINNSLPSPPENIDHTISDIIDIDVNVGNILEIDSLEERRIARRIPPVEHRYNDLQLDIFITSWAVLGLAFTGLVVLLIIFEDALIV